MSGTPEDRSGAAGGGDENPVQRPGRREAHPERAADPEPAAGAGPGGVRRGREQAAKVDPEDWAASSGSDDERFLRERPPHW